MCKQYVSIVFLHPFMPRSSHFSNFDFATFAGDLISGSTISIGDRNPSVNNNDSDDRNASITNSHSAAYNETQPVDIIAR